MVDEDEELLFADDEDTDESIESDRWKVMIVDDDEEIHSVTKLVLSKLTFQNKGLNLISAYSGAEAQKLIVENPDTAFMLLDVVMETPTAGLDTVKCIRNEIANQMVRIILRTGQPGQAPEKDVIDQYDINDYKEKTELTSQKLYTLLHTTLRSYDDIKTIHEHKVGLEKLIESSKEVFKENGLKFFANQILKQVTSFLDLEEDSVYFKLTSFAAHCEDKSQKNLKILAANGAYSDLGPIVQIDSLPDPIKEEVINTLKNKTNSFYKDYFFIYFSTDSGGEHILCLKNTKDIVLSDWESHLLGVFCANIAIALENIYLRSEIEDTQTEIIISLSESVEGRSKIAGHHIERIGLMAELLANKHGCETANMIKLASVTHDLGKVAIPDNILNKPGRLDECEWMKMKKHSSLGHAILKDSKKEVIKMAASIALEHHEKWDGNGYPNGIKGKDISIEARIVAVVDVFDALTNDRCYKTSWPIEDIIDYIKKQRGKHFDPDLVDVFLNNIDDFIEIKDSYKDGTDDINDYLSHLQI